MPRDSVEVVLRIVVVGVVASLGCDVARPTFECASWEDCGPGGACEPGTRACSFADDSCTLTGRRFSAISPAPYRDQCVEYSTDAPAGALCDPDEPTCGELRACLSDRCVSTVELDTGKRLSCGRCAFQPNAFGPLWCWGETLLLAPFEPRLLSFPGHGCPGPFCPPECAQCPGNETTSLCPVTCQFGSDITSSFAIGENYVCYNNGRLYCIGANGALQLGQGVPDLQTPSGGLQYVRVEQAYQVLAAGEDHNCATGAVSDRVFCWGSNSSGQLDMTGGFTGPYSASPLGNGPFTVSGGTIVGVEFIAVSAEFSCATSNSDVRCWGDVPWGAGVVAGLPPGQITDFDVGLHHACAIKGGNAVCWGNNRQGQVDPRAPSMLAPVTLALAGATRVVTGRAHSCAIDKAGAVWCWGDSAMDQLDGEAGPGPVLVRADPPAVGPISAGADVTCAVHADDRVRCWGDVLEKNAVAWRDFRICDR